jgi:hypothetical protein
VARHPVEKAGPRIVEMHNMGIETPSLALGKRLRLLIFVHYNIRRGE